MIVAHTPDLSPLINFLRQALFASFGIGFLFLFFSLPRILVSPPFAILPEKAFVPTTAHICLNKREAGGKLQIQEV